MLYGAYMPQNIPGRLTSLLGALLLVFCAITVIDLSSSPVSTVAAISGEISTNTIWIADQTIDGNLYVKSGVTLEIDEGISVFFKGYCSLTINGTLTVKGTKDKPVQFTTTNPTPSAGDWNMIYCNPDSECDMQNATVSYAERGLVLDGPAQFTVRHSAFTNMAKYGILAKDTQFGDISNCTFDGIGQSAVIADNCQEIDILGNAMNKIGNNGIELLNGTWAADLYYNTITNCSICGISVFNSDAHAICLNDISTCGNGIDRGGIYLDGSYGTYIEFNDIINNSGPGVFISGLSGGGMSYDSVYENTIQGNSLGGILALMTDNLTLQDNTMSVNDLWDISVDLAVDLQVLGNQLYDCQGAQCLRVRNSSAGDISYNTITSGAGPGIELKDCHDLDISWNTVAGCSADGVSIVDTGYCGVYDNTISMNTDSGLHLVNSHDIWLGINNVSNNFFSPLRLESSVDIYSDNDTFKGVPPSTIQIKSGSSIEFFNGTFDHDSVLVDPNSDMKAYYYLFANVVNEAGNPLSCNITVMDNESNPISYSGTDKVSWLCLMGYQVISGKYDMGMEPYTITATHGSGQAARNIDMGRACVFMTLQVFHPPDASDVPSNISFPEGSSYTSILGTLVNGNEPITLSVGPSENLTTIVSGNNLKLEIQPNDPDWNGFEALNLTFTDVYGTNTYRTMNVTVEPVNDLPVIMPQIDDVHAQEGVGTIFLNLSKNSVDKDLLYEGDTLRWYLVPLSDQIEVVGNNETDNLTLIVKGKDFFGSIQVIVHLFDSHGANASQMINVLIDNVNDPPVIETIPDQVTDLAGILVLDLTDKVSDIDDPLEALKIWCLSKYSKVSGIVISFNYSAAKFKEENVTVVVTDNHPGENSDSVTFKVRVNISAPPADDDIIDDDINVTDDDINVTDDDINVTDDDVDDDINVTDDDVDDDVNEDDGLSTYLIVLIIAVIILLLIGVGVVIFYVMRRKKREPEPVAQGPGRSVEAEVETSDVFKQRELAKAMGTKKAEPIEQMPPVEAAPDLAPLTPPGIEAMPSDDPYADGPGARTLAQPPESKPLLALPPAQIFEAEFEDMPKVDEIFISTKSGLLLKHFSYKETTVIDSDILSSMFTVIQNFIADSFGKRKVNLKQLTFGEFNILIDQGEYITAVIISSDKDVEKLEKPLHMMIQDLEFVNGDTFKDWDGSSDSLLGMQDCVNKLVNGGY